jgi:hypothetical protein
MVVYADNTDVNANLGVASASVIVITLPLLMDGVYHNCLVLVWQLARISSSTQLMSGITAVQG